MIRVMYIARHGCGGNDDEGAITHALGELGCAVIPVHETNAQHAHRVQADFCLFHKWYNPRALRLLKMPRAFWYFDLVDSGAPELRNRDNGRKSWMNDIVPLVDVGFCTDGDWVAKDPLKLVTLRQGADARLKGYVPRTEVKDIDVLFTGTELKCGEKRESFVQDVFRAYPTRFQRIRASAYREQLADVIARTRVVVAPDFPATDRYWSNRVYVSAGFGACVVHPRCAGLEYDDDQVVYYSGREDLLNAIDACLSRPEDAVRLGEAARSRTWYDLTYTDRCRELLRVVKERCL